MHIGTESAPDVQSKLSDICGGKRVRFLQYMKSTKFRYKVDLRLNCMFPTCSTDDEVEYPLKQLIAPVGGTLFAEWFYI